MNVSAVSTFFVLFSFILIKFSDCELHRVGRRQKGDTVLFKKILSTDWTFNLTNHSLTYEYRANEPVTSIEYQTMEKTRSEIIFTGENSILGTFSANNTTSLVITISVFGYHEQYTPQSAIIILCNMQQFINISSQYQKYNIFSIGKRHRNDDVRFHSTKRSSETLEPAKHSIDINFNIEYFITYIEILVNIKSANVIFLIVTDHTFQGVVYASDVRQLTVRIQIYGYVPNELPANYQSLFYSGSVYEEDDIIDDEYNSTEIILITNRCQLLYSNFMCMLFVLFALV